MTEIYLSREQSRNVDKIAIEEYGLSGLVLMENAGRACADTLCQLGIPGPVVICCGKGNNAGDGFVLARHLDLRRCQVRVMMWCDPSQLSGDAAANFRIIEKSEIPYFAWQATSDWDWLAQQLEGAAWIVDALLGTGARGQPRSPFDRVIRLLNATDALRLAVDIPSGLDCDTGEPAPSTFRAHHTCTFVAKKKGFRSTAAQGYLGDVHVLDIGAPRRLLDKLF